MPTPSASSCRAGACSCCMGTAWPPAMGCTAS
jgi:hypothetical protein